MKKRILFVDDEPLVHRSLNRLLRDQREAWQIDFHECPVLACRDIQASSYDVVVSDMRMPQMTGLQLLQELQKSEKTRHVPFIVLTGENDRSLKRQALDAGAVDLLHKPLDRDDLLARLNNAIRTRNYENRLRLQSERLEQEVQARTHELESTRLNIIWRLGKAAEFRDEATGNHVVRVGCYSKVIAEALGLDDRFVSDLFMAAPLHDIGKIGIPDSILFKPGALTREERRVMEQHCAIGASILSGDSKFQRVLGAFGDCQNEESTMECNRMMEMAAAVALTHHEKWDGSGYPTGLSGESIPIEARIVAIADVYDALRTKRPYKRSYSVAESLAVIDIEVGKHFDRAVYEAFQQRFIQIEKIEAELMDDVERDTQEVVDVGNSPAQNSPA